MKNKEIFILTLCLFVGIVLRLYTFDQRSLWIDEIHTFNESRDDLHGQIKHYQQNPTSLHPPLFFILTHSFYPFQKPERDLRIIPLIFGIISIPMIYFLAKRFSSSIALPCAISLAFMTYHIAYSQEGRMYSMITFLGMSATYFLMRYFEAGKIKYLLPASLSLALMFYASYSSVLFIAFVQFLWFYRPEKPHPGRHISSFLLFNGWILLFCIPWILFIFIHYNGQPFMDPLTIQDIGSLPALFGTMLNDWTPHLPLTVITVILVVLFPFFSKYKINALLLLAICVLPVVGLYSYCKLLHLNQFITSRYFISFLPLFLIILYLALEAIEFTYPKIKRYLNLKFLFLILFILTNLSILPLYYRSEKQDFRSLANYLNSQLRDGDIIIVKTFTYIPGILHYFEVYPKARHYMIPFHWKVPKKEFEFMVSLASQSKKFSIYHSNVPYEEYVKDGKRLWIIVGKGGEKEIEQRFPVSLKRVFDGSFAHFRRFPSDASMYLFLWNSNPSNNIKSDNFLNDGAIRYETQ